MASLANQTISSTYDGLIKTSSDNAVGVSGVQLLQDGSGNDLALSVGRSGNGVTITGSLNATLATAAQPNITSVGTLSSLAVSGDLTVDTDTLFVNASANRVGIGESNPNRQVHITNSAGSVYLKLEAGTTNNSAVEFGDSDSGNKGRIQYDHSDDSMEFRVNGSERLRIDSSGNVGIGTSSPATKVEISDASGSVLTLHRADTFLGSGNIIGDINFDADVTGTTIASIKGRAEETGTTKSYFAFETNDGSSTAERMRIDSSGYLRLAGAGIQFNGDTAAANALDDYEEGTFTPEVADATTGGNTGTGTFVGTYTKIGRLVSVNITLANINTTGMTSGNTIYIRNLPFTPSTATFTGNCWLDNITFTGFVTPNAVGGNNWIVLRQSSSNSGDADLAVSSVNISGSSDIVLSLTYSV